MDQHIDRVKQFIKNATNEKKYYFITRFYVNLNKSESSPRWFRGGSNLSTIEEILEESKFLSEQNDIEIKAGNGMRYKEYEVFLEDGRFVQSINI